MLPLLEILRTTDLENASKQDLRNLIKRVRISNKITATFIDLRTAGEIELRQYLQDIVIAHQPVEIEAIALQEAEVTEADPTHTLSDFDGIESKTITVEPDANRLVYILADGNYFDTVSHKSSLVPNPDSLVYITDANRYLEMNARSKSDFFTIAEPVYPLVFDHETPSFNKHARNALNALLRFGKYHGNEINTGWLSGILRDVMFRDTLKRVKEPMLLSDDIFYSLAGIDPLEVKIFKSLLANADDFNVTIPTPKEISQNLINVYGIDFSSQISVYRQLHKNILHLQRQCGVSSLHKKHFAMRDKLFTAYDYEKQLSITEADRIILKKEAFKITQYFTELTHDYTLLVENLENEECNPAPINLNILNLGIESDYVSIRSESIKWKQKNDGYYRSESEYFPLDPDKIELNFFKWDTELQGYDCTYALVAMHRDNSRFPWLA